MVVSFIGRGNRRTWRKPPTCHKSLTNFICIISRLLWIAFLFLKQWVKWLQRGDDKFTNWFNSAPVLNQSRVFTHLIPSRLLYHIFCDDLAKCCTLVVVFPVCFILNDIYSSLFIVSWYSKEITEQKERNRYMYTQLTRTAKPWES